MFVHEYLLNTVLFPVSSNENNDNYHNKNVKRNQTSTRCQRGRNHVEIKKNQFMEGERVDRAWLKCDLMMMTERHS